MKKTVRIASDLVKDLIEYWKRKAEKETGLEKECCMEHVKYYESLLLKK